MSSDNGYKGVPGTRYVMRLLQTRSGLVEAGVHRRAGSAARGSEGCGIIMMTPCQ